MIKSVATSASLKPLTKGDKLLAYLIATARCPKCGNEYLREQPNCPFCEVDYEDKGIQTLNESITQ